MDALKISEEALKDKRLGEGNKIGIQRRILKLAKPPLRWKSPKFDYFPNEPEEIYINGTLVISKLGEKNKYLFSDGLCSVEDLVLHHFKMEGWNGIHCETGLYKCLFSLLMWDVLFAPIPDVFQTPFQGISFLSTFFKNTILKKFK